MGWESCHDLRFAASFARAQAPDDEHCYCQASLRLYIAQLLARFLAASLTIRSTCETSRCPPRGFACCGCGRPDHRGLVAARPACPGRGGLGSRVDGTLPYERARLCPQRCLQGMATLALYAFPYTGKPADLRLLTIGTDHPVPIQ